MARRKPEKKIVLQKPARLAGGQSRQARGRRRKWSRKKAVRQQLPLTIGQVRLLGLDNENMTAAAGQIKDLTEPLEKLLEKYPKLAEAWQRGRFLRQLRQLAGTAVSISEAARALGMEGLALRELLDSDKEAADIWNQARLDVTVKIKTAMVEEAMKGKPAAIKQIERLLRRELAVGQADFEHVSIAEMVELTGKTRQTIHEWYTQYGLRRNSDATYNLKEFLIWFEDFNLRKRAPNKLTPADPLKDMKLRLQMEKLDSELKLGRGQLLDREVIIASLLARHQNLVNTLYRKSEDLAMLCHGQPPAKITEVLENFFEELRRQQCQVPEELRLPAAAAEKLTQLLAELAPEGQN